MNTPETPLSFIKMHGLGNDFVIVDSRAGGRLFSPPQIRRIADRKTGVGCDQFITLSPGARADVAMTIHNADGGQAEACGNAARCVAALVLEESGGETVTIEAAGRVLRARASGVKEGEIEVDMGAPSFDWCDIPLAREMDTLALDYICGPLASPAAVNVGNPHVVFFVEDVASVDLEKLGPLVEHDPLFPARVNVNIVAVGEGDAIRLRVWERGVGVTRACGTGACASAVAAARRGLTGRRVAVDLDGGRLIVDWRAGEHIMMTGPAARSFSGVFDPALVEEAQ
jgi:diaminopimelate epimerase